MRKRTLKSLERKSKNLIPYYCKKCGMIMSKNQKICNGCKEAQAVGKASKDLFVIP